MGVGVIFGLAEDQDGDGGGERGEAQPEGAGADVVAVDGGVAAAPVVGDDVDGVVLLDVVRRGVVEALGGGEVEFVDLVAVGAVAHEGGGGALAVDREVTGQGDGVEDRELVAVDAVAAGAVDFAEHGEAQVHEFHGHDGVLGLAAGLDALLDVVADFGAGLALDVQAPQDGEIDAAVGVDGVAGDVRGGGGGGDVASAAGQRLLFADAAGVVREVEHRGDLGFAGVDDDGDLVHRLEADGLRGDVGDGGGVGGVLQVDDVAGRRAPGHERQRARVQENAGVRG